jgi:hypothetical protein
MMLSWQIVKSFGQPAKYVFDAAALLLSIINGLMLLRFYTRDRARLRVDPIHPNTYQWWFELPPGQFEKQTTRRYGFLVYVGIRNSGLRKTQITSWRLSIRSARRWHELKPTSMPEPTIDIGTHAKCYSVLGQRSVSFDGATAVDAGGSISGMAYFLYECYGGTTWDPQMLAENIKGSFRIEDAFGHRAKCKILFAKKSLHEIETFSPGIQAITDAPKLADAQSTPLTGFNSFLR